MEGINIAQKTTTTMTIPNMTQYFVAAVSTDASDSR